MGLKLHLGTFHDLILSAPDGVRDLSQQHLPRNLVRVMASRDIYENAFDEDVQVTVVTVYEDCGLVLEFHPIDHGPVAVLRG